MTWRLVRSLERLREQVRAAAPRAVPPATPASAWGTIGDTAHSSTSDHSPHVYAALGSVPVVCAADFPHAPALGLDAAVFTEALRRSRDPRIAYVICNRRVFSGRPVDGVPAYTWRAYSGSDPHDTHWHVSVVHTAAADDTRDWAMPGTAGAAGGSMTLTLDTIHIGPDGQPVALGTALARLYNESFATRATLAAVAAKVDIDPGELAAISDAAKAGAAEALAAGQEQLITALVQAVGDAAAVDAPGAVSDAAIEAAVRRVFADAGSS